MGGTGIEIKTSHVSIGVSDMERSIAFYRDVFGWEQIFDERMEGAAFEELTRVPGAAGRACGGRIGSLRVELMQFNFIPDGPAPSGSDCASSRWSADAHAAQRARGRGVPVLGSAGGGVRRPHVLRHRSRWPGHRDVRVRPVAGARAVRTGDRGARSRRRVGLRRRRRRPHPRTRQPTHVDAELPPVLAIPGMGEYADEYAWFLDAWATAASSSSTCADAGAATSPSRVPVEDHIGDLGPPSNSSTSTSRSSSRSRVAARTRSATRCTYPSEVRALVIGDYFARPRRAPARVRRATVAEQDPRHRHRRPDVEPCGAPGRRREPRGSAVGPARRAPVPRARHPRWSEGRLGERASSPRSGAIAPHGGDRDRHRRRPRSVESRRRRLPRGAGAVPGRRQYDVTRLVPASRRDRLP